MLDVDVQYVRGWFTTMVVGQTRERLLSSGDVLDLRDDHDQSTTM